MDITKQKSRIIKKKKKNVGHKKDVVEQKMKEEMLNYTKKFGKIVRIELSILYAIYRF